MLLARLIKALFFLVIILISAVISIPMILYKVGWILSESVVNDMFRHNDDDNENNGDDGNNNINGKGATT